jgi:hypothetical protein
VESTAIEIWKPKDKEIELKVSAHRGHYQQYGHDLHPRNLLDGKEGTYYMSKDGVTSGDWIEFEMCEEAVVIPTKIRIRNYRDSSAIKVISVSIGTGDGSWHKLVGDITDIQRQKDTEQEFVFGELLVTPQWIWENSAKYIRMEIRRNRGWSQNVLCAVLPNPLRRHQQLSKHKLLLSIFLPLNVRDIADQFMPRTIARSNRHRNHFDGR